jgi:hypothetical protein
MISSTRCGIATFPMEAVDELDDLAQAIEIQQVRGGRWRIETWRGGIVGPAHRDGGMKTVGESDDEIWVGTSADADDLNLLAAQWMIRMGNGHQSRRALG